MATSPRIVGAHRPDTHSLATILASPRFAGLSGEALALAIHDWLTDPGDGMWHFWPVDEHRGLPRLRRFTSDPIKLLNVYGWAICAQAACILHGLYTAAGLEARMFTVPGHVLCEVRYDDAWHVLDADMWTWFRNQRGAIAGAAELARDPQRLILDNRDRSQPCNVPDRSLTAYAEMYAGAKPVGDACQPVFPHWSVRSHSMDLFLRPGEALRRSTAAEGCFPCPEAWLAQIADGHAEWRGQPRERHAPERSYANGSWRYAPILTADHDDVAVGCWQRDGITQTASGIVGPGTIGFRLQSPYLITARPEIGPDAVRYRDGARLWLRSRGAVRVALELDDRRLVLDTGAADGERTIDLTEPLTGRYEGLLVFELTADAVLEAFAFEAPILCAPLALPKLEAGCNHLELRRGDGHGKRTVPQVTVVDMRPDADPSAAWAAADNARVEPWVEGWQRIAPTDPAQPVTVTWRFDAPTGKPVAWFHALTSIAEGPPDAARGRASLAWSIDGETWHELRAIDIPNSPLGWDTSLEGDVVLPQPATAIHLRVTSATAITGLEYAAHLALGQPETELEVEHRWWEGGEERTLIVRDPERYALTCAAAPTRHELTIRGLNRPR